MGKRKCARLKQDSTNVRASPRSTVLASGDRSSRRDTSSSFFPFCLCWRLVRSITAPAAECWLSACCRCRTSGWDWEDVVAGSSGATGSPASPWGVAEPAVVAIFFGFNRTEIVVPKRE